MPNLNGPKVIGMIRELEQKIGITKEKQAKVFMVTAHADQETVMESIGAGCNDYLVKPFAMKQFAQKMEKNGLV